MKGYVLKIDRSKYFCKIRCEMALSAVRKRVLDELARQEADHIIRRFDNGEK